MAACRAEVPDLPAILRQSAEIDGLDIDTALAQLESSLVEFHAPEQEPETGHQDCSVPLWDANHLYCRHISEGEAWRLIDADNAVGLMACEWNTDRRRDLPLIGVQLRVPRAVIQWTPSGITQAEMELVAGLYGDVPAARASRAKLAAWPKTGDDRAPRVGVRWLTKAAVGVKQD